MGAVSSVSIHPCTIMSPLGGIECSPAQRTGTEENVLQTQRFGKGTATFSEHCVLSNYGNLSIGSTELSCNLY